MKLQEFIEKFAEAIEVGNIEVLTGNSKFRELDEWSSLSIMLLIAFFDETFEKEIGESDIRSCTTIQIYLT